jgi:ATP-dependent 26S proteasome regulatory subunit
MQFDERLIIQGIPETVSSEDGALLRSRLFTAVNRLRESANLQDISLTINMPDNGKTGGSREAQGQARSPEYKETSIEKRVQQYQVRKPLYTFEQSVVPEETIEDLLAAVETIQFEPVVFQQWGLRKIEPYPSCALNLHGPSGTGKTLAAHAIAEKPGRDMLIASYVEVESKYVGDGPKNVQALFLAVERNNAVLFIDKADSLLSRRLLNVTQRAEQAINSMRNQLLLCRGQFSGIVIFATNLVKNYDKAFETLVRHVAFALPDVQARARIWERLLVTELPVHDIAVQTLAETISDVSGRDIKNAILDAAVRAARQQRFYLTMENFLQAAQRIKAARIAEGRPVVQLRHWLLLNQCCQPAILFPHHSFALEYFELPECLSTGGKAIPE